MEEREEAQKQDKPEMHKNSTPNSFLTFKSERNSRKYQNLI